MPAKDPTLVAILAEVKKISSKVTKIETRLAKVEKSVFGLEKDMKKVLKCVSHENAEDFPPIKSNGSAHKLSVAAKPH